MRTLLIFCLLSALSVSFAFTRDDVSGLHVCGNKICNGQGQTIRLIGVDRSGTEFMCIQNHGIFDGPTDNASISAIQSWAPNVINFIRIPLNEDCWLGINGVSPQYGGSNYINAVSGFVERLNNKGFAVILDLHWTAPGSTPATKQLPMADRDHSLSFWTGVANHFKDNSAVLFDLFNEPFPDNGNWNSETAWRCWRDGGSSCPGLNYQAAGMQSLVDAVRSTGAKNIVTLGGLAWSNSMAEWITYKPTDSTGNTAVSWHSYNFNYCNNEACWNQYVLPVLKRYPILTTEFGENDCNSGYISSLLNWLDSQGASGYSAWTWNTWNCNDGPALITGYEGTPTNYGAGYKAHLQRLEAQLLNKN
eukprot:TRINITY_DN10317_c0_g1_i1.p1 TRINITY_DN10317_c0_g1~~TRINITY_DN10317_c0_g1_i1.p1  ORF type:complete len:376 (-),score=69.96 TRINITY_DN10317_c0_g1_i1:68-1153(-)